MALFFMPLFFPTPTGNDPLSRAGTAGRAGSERNAGKEKEQGRARAHVRGYRKVGLGVSAECKYP